MTTVAFLDLCGFSAWTRRHGDLEAARVVVRLREVVRRAAAEHGVAVHLWTGDGAMLVGDERDDVLACARACVEQVCSESPLALRAGIASGSCIVLGDGDLVGDTVNRAFALCDVASPARVAVDVTAEPAPAAAVA